MIRLLLVGDPHITADELEDGQHLIDGIHDTASAEDVDAVVFMGDQFHNHSIVHVDVLAFWQQALRQLAKEYPVCLLIGNHDMSSNTSSHATVMSVFEDMSGVYLFRNGESLSEALPRTEADDVTFINYCHTQEEFAKAHKGSVVLCHQTFNGAQYDNGFYAKDGFDLKLVEGSQVFSGHIHTPQIIGNVTYIGSPRWRTVSDAGVNKGIVVLDVDSGVAKVHKVVPTDQWCKRIVQIVDKEAEPSETTMNPAWSYVVDVIGSKAFVQGRMARWTGARIRTFVQEEVQKQIQVEPTTLAKAVSRFASTWSPPFGTPKNILQDLIAQRVTE